MNVNRDHGVEFGGTLLPSGSCVIHFYYTSEEQLHFAGFLSEGLEREEGIVLVAPPSAMKLFLDRLAPLPRRASRFERVDLESAGDHSLAAIVQAVGRVVQYGPARVLADFGDGVHPEALCEVEAQLFSAVAGLPLVSLTQYDGSAFSAGLMLEQFRTHALAVVGNAFYQENLNFTSPARYLQMRATASSRG